MAKTKGQARANELLDTMTTANTPSDTTGNGSTGTAPGTGSVKNSPYDQNAMNAAQAYGANANMQRLAGSNAVGNADAFMQNRQEANATPTSLEGKYNVTGIGANATNRLSRLADALNSKKWVYSTAEGGVRSGGRVDGGPTVQEMQMPGVNTAEQRQQRRMEEWQGTAATNELNTRQWLSRIAPQLEVARQQSIMQLEQQLDKLQVDAATQALDNYFRETYAEFSTNERLRAAAQLAKALKALGNDDVTRSIMSQAYGVAAGDKITNDLTEVTNITADALARGDWETVRRNAPAIAMYAQLLPGLASVGAISSAKNLANSLFVGMQPVAPRK